MTDKEMCEEYRATLRICNRMIRKYKLLCHMYANSDDEADDEKYNIAMDNKRKWMSMQRSTMYSLDWIRLGHEPRKWAGIPSLKVGVDYQSVGSC